MGMLRVAPAARCFRPRSSRLAPSSVHPVPAWGVEAARSIRPHPQAGRTQSVSQSATASAGGSAQRPPFRRLREADRWSGAVPARVAVLVSTACAILGVTALIELKDSGLRFKPGLLEI